MKARFIQCTLWLLMVVGATAAAAAAPVDRAASGGERRVALVIGNGQYRNVLPLKNPPSDARLVAQTLQSLGFQLVGDGVLLDADRVTMESAIRAFGKRLRGGAVGLFYYAGHGVQVDGENYLAPVSATIEDPADIKYELISVAFVLDEMRNAGNRLNIVILDACRNNPFGAAKLRALTRGLAVMQAPAGTIVSYATQPGNTAADGRGSNSPYATALTAAMNTPGLSVFETFNDVGLAVKAATGGTQQPWFDTSPIEGNFRFRQGEAGAAATAPVPAGGDANADERAFWESVRNSRNSAEFEAYVSRYPHGLYTDLAYARIEELNAAAAPGARAEAPAGAAARDAPASSNTAAKSLHFGLSFIHHVQTTATPVGGHHYPPGAANAPVTIYASAAEAPRSFEVVAMISHADPCPFHRCTLQDAIIPLSAKAREVGANGIILDGVQTVKTSLTSTGIAVDARAIRTGE